MTSEWVAEFSITAEALDGVHQDPFTEEQYRAASLTLNGAFPLSSSLRAVQNLLPRLAPHVPDDVATQVCNFMSAGITVRAEAEYDARYRVYRIALSCRLPDNRATTGHHVPAQIVRVPPQATQQAPPARRLVLRRLKSISTEGR